MPPIESALRQQITDIDKMLLNIAHYKALIAGIGFQDLTVDGFLAQCETRRLAILAILEDLPE